MSTISDILQVADRIISFLRKDNQTDISLYEELIDPLYLQLATIVPELIAMYGTTFIELNRLDNLYKKKWREHLDDIHESFMKICSMTEDNEGERKKLLDLHELESKKLGSKVKKLILETHLPELESVIEEFKSKRASSRTARMKADAAACALIQHYSIRKDVFATRVIEFATQLRILVGRAHNKPFEKDYGDYSHEAKRSGSELVDDNLTRFLDSIKSQERSFEVDYSSNVLSDSIEISMDANIGNGQFNDIGIILFSISKICEEIDSSWEKIIYIYAMMRIALEANRKA